MRAGRVRLAAAAALVAAAASACGGSSDAGPARPAAAGGGATASAARPRGSVTFGVLAPLSGPDAARGRDLLDGAKLAVADLNVAGGVLGKRAALVSADDGCEAGSARTAARRLAGEDVAGVLGGVCTSAARAAVRALVPSRLPVLVTSATAPTIVDPTRTPNAYLESGTPYQEALATVHWLAYMTAQRLAVVTDAGQASRALARGVIGLSDPAPKVVSRQTLRDATPDWSAIAQIALAAKPDTVYWAGAADASGALLAALRGAGFDGTFVASAQSESPRFLAAAGGAGAGAYVVAPASPQNLPAAAGWAKRFSAAYERAPGRDALRAYDGLRALAQAVTQTGKVDAKLNAAQLPRLEDSYRTFLGGLQFASDHTVKYDEHIVLTVSGGAFKVASTLRSDSGG